MTEKKEYVGKVEAKLPKSGARGEYFSYKIDDLWMNDFDSKNASKFVKGDTVKVIFEEAEKGGTIFRNIKSIDLHSGVVEEQISESAAPTTAQEKPEFKSGNQSKDGVLFWSTDTYWRKKFEFDMENEVKKSKQIIRMSSWDKAVNLVCSLVEAEKIADKTSGSDLLFNMAKDIANKIEQDIQR